MTVAYPLVCRHVARGRLGDLLTADLRCAIAGADYEPGADHEWFTDVAETAGAGYIAGGLPLTGRTIDDTSPGSAVLLCDPVVYDDAYFPARYAIVYRADEAGPAASPLICYVDFGVERLPAGDPLLVAFPSGVVRYGPDPA